MAVIGSIRKRSGLLIILIGVALVLFLLSDSLSSGGSMFAPEETTVGTIAGEDVSQRDFEIRIQEILDTQYGAEGANDQVRQSIRDNVWQQMINERIVKVEQGKVGIAVSPDELMDQVRNTKPGSILYQYFTDRQTGQIIEQFRNPQTGGLDNNKVLQAIQNLVNSENAKDWLPIEQAIKEDVAMTKYVTLISKGLTATSAEAEQRLAEQGTAYDVSFAVKEFGSVPDSDIEVSESELKDYYNEHKSEARFQSEYETRSVKFISFNATASEEDINEIERELQELVPLFQADTNDTAFVAENADNSIESMISYKKAERIDRAIRDTVVNAPIGAVFGPYRSGALMLVSKLSDIEYSPDSVRASHILISVQDGDTNKIAAAKEKLDSLKTVAQANNNFAALATEFSEDFGSAQQGGDLDWFTRGRMVPEFEQACFNGEVGDMMIVVSQFGVHLISITDQTEDKKLYLISSVDRLIEASKYTRDQVYKEASTFALNHKTLEAINKIESGPDMEIQPAEGLRLGDDQMGPIFDAKEAVQWAFDAEVGQVSSPVEVGDQFLVITLTDIREKGTMSFASARVLIEPDLIKEKKAEKFKAAFGDYTSVDQAASNAGVEKRTAENIHFSDNSMPNGIGREPAFIGAVSTLNEGQASKPIVGNRGVFVASVTKKIPAAEGGDVVAEKNAASEVISTRVERQVIEALKKQAGVEDNRGRYY